MHITKHAEMRCQQRGIPREIVEVLLLLGQSHKRPGGVTELRISKRDKSEFLRGLSRVKQLVERAAATIIIAGDDDVVVTAYKQ